MKDSRVGIIDVRAVRAVQGRVLKLLDNLFLLLFRWNDELKLDARSTYKFSDGVLFA